MSWHREIWTYLIVTLVAVLIWAWAASETRERKNIPSARVQFVVSNAAGDWVITPADVPLSINIEGTKLAVQRLTNDLRRPLNISVPVNSAHATLDLAEVLRTSDVVLKTGAAIVSTDPATVELELDQIERVRVPVTASLPGVTADGAIIVQPHDVTVSMPHAMAQRLPQNFAVEAFVEASQLEQLEPGVPQTLDVKPRFPPTLAVGPEARIAPAKVKLSFTIRSRIRETLVDSVRVQIAGPSEDRDAFVVDVEPKVLRGVSVLADADLSRQIESGEVPVIAMVHLSSREKESMIDRKPVSMFIALVPEMAGGTRYVQLNVKQGATMPVIDLKITNRAQSP